MKITKNLKYATFEWDDEEKEFTLSDKDGNKLTLNKVYSFAFMRFVIRMAQRNWYRKITKEKKEEAPVSLAEHPFEDQLDLWDKADAPKLKKAEIAELLQEVNNQFQKDAENDENPF